MAETIQPGKYVTLTYAIRDLQGNLLEQNDLPVSYIYGGDMVLIGGMDAAIRGKNAGDEVEFDVSVEEGFGAWDPNLTFTDDLDNVPPEFRQLGAEIQMQNEAGDVKSFYVTKIENGQLTVDGNHPLAGKALRVRVNIHEVRDATPNDAMVDDGQHRLN